MFIASDYEKYYKVKRGDVVIDLGAFNGRHTLLYSKDVGQEGTVVSVEASQLNYIKLLNIIDEFRLSNVVPMNLGVHNKNGIEKFNTTNDFQGAASTFFTDVSVEKTQLTSVITLDTLVKMLDLKKVDFIKSDIEGAEIEAFEGAEQTLAMCNHVAIGSYHIRGGEPTAERIEKILKKSGMEVCTEPGNIDEGFTDEIVTYGIRK